MTIDRQLDNVVAAIARPWKELHPASCPPMLAHAASRRYCHSTHYGPNGLGVDIWRRPDTPLDAPMLLFVPGGAWISGRRVGQGYALLHHLADRGYLCASIDYRTSPLHRWPAHITDVRDAITWARDTFDSPFLTVAGASAGGHLASLAALTGSPVDAVVSLYGAYDWCSRAGLIALGTGALATAVIVQRWGIAALREASPIHQVHPDAPPFLIVQGDRDRLTPAAGAREFHRALSKVSRARADYVEVRGGHAFDLVRCASTTRALTAIDGFLDDVRSGRRSEQTA